MSEETRKPETAEPSANPGNPGGSAGEKNTAPRAGTHPAAGIPASRRAPPFPGLARKSAAGHARGAGTSSARQLRIEERVAKHNRGLMKIIFVFLGLVLVVGFLAKGSQMKSAGKALSLRDALNHDQLNVYKDPDGLFSIGVPPGWIKLKQDPEMEQMGFRVSFRGPHDIEMRVQCVVSNEDSFADLCERIRKVERQMEANTHIGVTNISGWHVVTRYTQLWKTKVRYLDFRTGNLNHHLQFVVPTALYDEYDPLFFELVRKTYKPGETDAPASPPPGD